MEPLEKSSKTIKNLFSSGTADFIKIALTSFKSNDETIILAALNELSSELSMANDNVGDDANYAELIHQLVILLDKYPMLPDISFSALNCINYILDINPRSTNTVIKYNGINKIVNLTKNVEFIETVEYAIKAIEKMSYENIFALIDKNAFISVLEFIDFFDLNLRKSSLKACVNMSKGGNTIDYLSKHILPAIPQLTNLTRLNGDSEIEKTIVDLAIQTFYNIIYGTRSYNFSADLNKFCDNITQFGLVDILFDLFLRFISIEEDDEQEHNNKDNNNIISSSSNKVSIVNVNVETIKTTLKIFEIFCLISPKITNYLLNNNTLELIYKVLKNELTSNNNETNKRNKNNKLSSSSHSLYNEIFKLLISFFPSKIDNNNDELNKIMSKENKNYFLYFSENILVLLMDNILHIPSTETTLGVIKLISMYCSNSSNEYIIKFINDKQLANSIGKMLDSKDTSYITEVLKLIDFIMQKVPEHFFINLLREGVLDNIKKCKEVDKKLLYISKDSTVSKSKSNLTISSPSNDVSDPKKFADEIANNIHSKAKLIEDKYFTEEKIKNLLNKCKEKGDIINPFDIMNKLNEYKKILEERKADKTTIKEIIDVIIKNKVTFYEIEKSEIVFYICFYLDENFIKNNENSVETDTLTEVKLANEYNKNIIKNIDTIFSAFNYDSDNIKEFVKILQQCVSSMNCFKLFLYEYDSLKSTANLFLSAFSGKILTKLSSRLGINFSLDDTTKECKDIIEDIKKEKNEIMNSIDFFIKNKKNKINVETDKTLDELKEDIINYPYKKNNSNDIEDDYYQDLIRMLIQRGSTNIDQINFISSNTGIIKSIIEKKKIQEQIKNNSNTQNNKFDETDNKESKDEESINKGDNKKDKDKEKSNNKDNVSNNNVEDDDEDTIQTKINENVSSFLNKYDLIFWINLSDSKKYEINKDITITELLRNVKNNLSKKDFGNFCTDFKINFSFIKIDKNKNTIIEEKNNNNNQEISSFNLPKEEIKKGNLEKLLFEKFYYEYIVNNKSLYNIKKACPFFYLITVIELCQGTFNKFFKINKIEKENFENLKMSTLLFKQVKDPYSISYNSVPSWCKELNSSYPFLTSFSSRYLLFKTTSFDNKRSMFNLYIYLRNFQGENIFEDKSINSLTANLIRNKVKIHREKIIDESYILSNQFKNYTGYIEYEYYNETGTGTGPTLEFYSSFFKEIKNLKNIWYKTEDYSLFPKPLINYTNEHLTYVKKIFTSIGYVTARGIYDGRLIDVPINSLFWDLVLNRPINIQSINKVDKYISDFLSKYNDCSKNEKENLKDCDIYFNLPWDENTPLIENGSDIILNENNINEYIYEVMNKLLFIGQKEIIESFTDGFNRVFNVNELKCFTSNEIQDIICGSGSDDDTSWEYEHLIQNIIPSHGFTKESLVYKWLVDFMIKLGKNERKLFLLFVTGTPRLPIGGFKNLYPKLTVVMYQSEKHIKGNVIDNPDDHLPSVMTCQNYLKIPNYSSEKILKKKLDLAINEGINAFHLS